MSVGSRFPHVVAASLCSLIAAVAFAETNVMFIIDSSGSMKKAVGQESRMEAAKRALGQALLTVPADVRLGLMLYGHRKAKDCADIELVSPLGAEEATALAAKIQALQPKGETPIAESLKYALRSFNAFKGQSNRIVLVTDGIEECRGDPCAAAQAVNEAGVDLKVDIVGFTLDDAQRKTIECVTRTTGGTYYDAKDAAALSAALGTVRQVVAQAAPPPALLPPTPAEFNLLAPANGGQVIAAPAADWTKVISGNDRDEVGARFPAEAIFAFKDEQPATFDKFTMLIAANASGNPQEFELLAADDLSGPFRPLGNFRPQNLRLLRTPYQEFSFAETTAKYLKLKMISGYGATGAGGFQRVPQIRLIGELAEEVEAVGRQPASPSATSLINLLLAANGGALLAAPDAGLEKTISGNDDDEFGVKLPAEMIFAFQDEKPATFSLFSLLIKAQASGNPREFELFAADDLSGPFRSLGKFQPQNIRIIRAPYQEFTLPETTARYLKFVYLSSYGATGAGGYSRVPQLRLMGKFN